MSSYDDDIATDVADAALEESDEREQQIHACMVTIRDLKAENERLKAEVSRAWAESREMITDWRHRAEQAEQENERLKAELDNRAVVIDGLVTLKSKAERQLKEALAAVEPYTDPADGAMPFSAVCRLAAILKQETTIDGNG